MFHRRTILYLFLAGCLTTTTAAASPSRASIPRNDSCPAPNLPPISFQPHRTNLTPAAKTILRQAAANLLSCDQRAVLLVVTEPSSCKPNSEPTGWDRAVHTADFLCTSLHVPSHRVMFRYKQNGPPDKLVLDWIDRDDFADTTIRPHPNLRRKDVITVHFDLDRFTLDPQADSILTRVVPAMNNIQTLTITGYCDNTGSEAHNNQLSLARARTVSEYLTRHGLDSTVQINCTGYGTRDPINDNSTAAERALNRRVAIVLHRLPPPEPATTAQPEPATATTTPPATAPALSPPASRPTIPPEPVTHPAPPDSISRPVNRSVYMAITDTTTRIGTTVTLKDVVFIGGRHIPLGYSYIVLDELLKAMSDNHNLRIRIEGHVCCVAARADGLDYDTGTPDLSLQRAKFIYEYLIKNGISSDRMSYAGLGGANKIYPEELTPAQQTINRRVEIRIIGK